MVLQVTKYDIHPDKLEAFQKWVEGAIKRCMSVPGVVEYRAYRGAAGAPQIVSTWEFADMSAWAAWSSSEDMQKLYAEAHTLAVNVTTELWGPSPVVPAPVRPGK
jgi:quinol monooxygenase YgiN